MSLPTILQFDPYPYREQIMGILNEVSLFLREQNLERIEQKYLQKILHKYPKDGTHLFNRGHLIIGYQQFSKDKLIPINPHLIHALQLKPVRTQSGVTPVTVLTKPFPCPGQCIFCPNDVRMPKSYLADEPGAMRAQRNAFDPYLQTYNRLLAFHYIGHNVEKIEIIILGGTWSFYPRSYQIWFVKRIFDALNDFSVVDRRHEVKANNKFESAKHPGTQNGKRKTYNQLVKEIVGGKTQQFFDESESATYEELEQAHKKNETALSRNVGLVIETRPDEITQEELIHIRRLGATKIQIGIQSLNDEVLQLNKRGHTAQQTKNAVNLIRLGGFKIHAHWMPNLHGSSPDKDIEDYQKLWTQRIHPDEVKLYPCSIIPNTELSDLYKHGTFSPYTHEELLHVLENTIPYTPRYTRLTRIIRDIPSTDIEAGNKITNFREVAEKHIREKGKIMQDIRSREVKTMKVSMQDLMYEEIMYDTEVSKEFFLSYKTKKDDKIAAFLRLSFPKEPYKNNHYFRELQECAMIREVHVYGQVVGIGKQSNGKAQHLGLGTLLTQKACVLSQMHAFKKLAVISAIGTREYYRKRGFFDNGLYLIKDISQL